ncbi:hypothetical protein ACIA8R_46245 [Nonomuraea sp. NPDC051191]|uniref:hypothetical protein n=1 Tax=Nonomuraea sp. NPDC051191 TaxID=3364372 RepID=UPI0037B3B378
MQARSVSRSKKQLLAVDIHAVRDWCPARGVALRVLSGPLSNFHDLAANDATTAPLINVTSVGQFQHDIQNELTVEGIAAEAEAEGRYRGRPPALAPSLQRCVRRSLTMALRSRLSPVRIE